MQHVFEVATGFGLCGVATIAEHFRIGEPEDRVLLVMNSVPAPEAVPALHESPEYAPLLEAFGRVVYLNDLIAPEHPFGWSPEPDTHHARLATAQLLAACGIAEGEPHTLWIESIQGTASHSLARLFDRAAINVYSDGLMTYGPTRIDVPAAIGDRIAGVFHLDLVPEQSPFVLREYAPEYHPFPVDAFLRTARATAVAGAEGPGGPVSLVLGQYLADLGLLTPAEDTALLERMIEVALAAEPTLPVLVRPHPRASGRDVHAVLARFVDRGADVRLAPRGGLVETLYEDLDVRLVVSCFSTALFTARALGIRTVAVGAREVLRALRPYQNSNRMAIVLADLLNERTGLARGGIDPAETDAETIELVVAMTSLSMQSGVLEGLIGRYDRRLLALPGPRRDIVRRYVSAARLARLVPGLAAPARPPVSRLRRWMRRVPLARAAWRAARRTRAVLPARRAAEAPR